MSSSPNWGKLYEQGRCKFIGVPWDEKEAHAVFELKIPAEFVRDGCLTLEEYNLALSDAKKEEESTGEKPLRFQSKAELMKLAESMEILFTSEVKRLELIQLITVKRKKATSTLPEVVVPDEGSQES